MNDRGDGDRRERKTSDARGVGLSAGLVFSAGFSIIASAFAGLCLGIFLDRRRQGTLFAPIGLVLGLLVGLHRVYLLFRLIAKGKAR